jgi:hypothetical protein
MAISPPVLDPPLPQDPNAVLSFKNEHIIYENEVRCKVGENDFNMSMNPTISIDNSGSLRDFATGSIFAPYVTTVGLYNNRSELLAVAKLAQPIPLSSTTDTVFVVKYDI